MGSIKVDHFFQSTLFDRVRSLSDILCDLENVLNKRSLTARQKQDLHSIVEGCRDVLIDLNKVMDKYHCLIVSPKSLGDKSQRLWKKLRWEIRSHNGTSFTYNIKHKPSEYFQWKPNQVRDAH